MLLKTLLMYTRSKGVIRLYVAIHMVNELSFKNCFLNVELTSE